MLFSQLQQNGQDEQLPATVASVMDGAESPGKRLDTRAQRKRVRAAVEQLPQKYQVVVALYYWEHLSYEEVAKVLNLPVNTIRTHLRRAKNLLQTQLQSVL